MRRRAGRPSSTRATGESRHRLAGFFYSVDIETLAASDCPLLDDATVDAVAQAMYSDEATYGAVRVSKCLPRASRGDRDYSPRYGALLDGGAFGQRDDAGRGRSRYALASPRDGYTDVADGVKEGSQYRKMAKDMRCAVWKPSFRAASFPERWSSSTRVKERFMCT